MQGRDIRRYLKILCSNRPYDERLTAGCNLLAEIDDGSMENWDKVQYVSHMLHDILRTNRWRTRRTYAKNIEKILFKEEYK